MAANHARLLAVPRGGMSPNQPGLTADENACHSRPWDWLSLSISPWLQAHAPPAHGMDLYWALWSQSQREARQSPPARSKPPASAASGQSSHTQEYRPGSPPPVPATRRTPLQGHASPRLPDLCAAAVYAMASLCLPVPLGAVRRDSR